ncbi:hypothetical protein ACIBO9_49480 [Streptomyces prunicolor]|uniref:hypothetical protein n=1 Tax=Streptomyces prunicolor TaxID=67348 RepID=UPI0037D5111E
MGEEMAGWDRTSICDSSEALSHRIKYREPFRLRVGHAGAWFDLDQPTAAWAWSTACERRSCRGTEIALVAWSPDDLRRLGMLFRLLVDDFGNHVEAAVDVEASA